MDRFTPRRRRHVIDFAAWRGPRPRRPLGGGHPRSALRARRLPAGGRHPAVDRGHAAAPPTDLHGTRRPVGAAVNIGAMEHCGADACPTAGPRPGSGEAGAFPRRRGRGQRAAGAVARAQRADPRLRRLRHRSRGGLGRSASRRRRPARPVAAQARSIMTASVQGFFLASMTAAVAACGGGGGDDVGPPSGRLIITAARLVELEEMVAAQAPEWQALVANVDAEMDSLDPYRSGPENVCLVYLMTGEPAYAAAAWLWIDGVMDDADVRFDSYLHYGDYMRQVATVLNYCYEGLDGGKRSALAELPRAVDRRALVRQPGQRLGARRSGQQLPHGVPGGDGVRGLRAAGGRSGQGRRVHRDPRRQARQDGRGDGLPGDPGGGRRLARGGEPGQRSKQRLFAALSVVAGAGSNYFATRPFFGEAIRYAVYQLQPDHEAIYPGGDMTREASMLVSPFDREYIHSATYWLGRKRRGAGRGPVLPRRDRAGLHGARVRPAFDYRDFLFGRAIAAATPESSLPTFYRSPGAEWVSSRSSWADDATCLSISGAPIINQSHAHMDTGSFTIWKHGWLAVDAATFTESGLPWAADAHGLVPGHERRGGDMQGADPGPRRSGGDLRQLERLEPLPLPAGRRRSRDHARRIHPRAGLPEARTSWWSTTGSTRSRRERAIAGGSTSRSSPSPPARGSTARPTRAGASP